MTNDTKYYSGRQKAIEPSKGSMRRGRRGLRIFLILAEVLCIAVLSVSVYALGLISGLQRTDINHDELYVYNGIDSGITVLGTVEPEAESSPQTTTVSEKPTLEEITGAQTDPQAGWEVETQEIATREDFLEHQASTANGFWNILLLGCDAKANGDLNGGDYRADVIMICSINVQTKVIRLASIYRDTIVLMYGQDTYHKINECIFSGYNGSPTAMLSTINQNFDLDIQDVVVVNWAAMVLAVNILGGLDLEITEDEINRNIIQGYLTTVVQETGIGTDGQFTAPGLQHCDGPKVVAYCRNRYTSGTDTGRAGRQREVLEKMLEKAKTVSLPTMFQLVSVCFSNIYTSLSLEEMYGLVADVQNYTIGETAGFPTNYVTQKSLGQLTSVYKISDPMVPNTLINTVRELHAFLFNDNNYEPSQNVKTISNNLDFLSQN